jgi:[NiFe] hydrogenase diaphorase moiety large subunit
MRQLWQHCCNRSSTVIDAIPCACCKSCVRRRKCSATCRGPALTAIADAVELPRARVEGVAGFYSFLHLQPVGRYRILFSDNVTDRMLGSVELMDRLCNRLWIERGKVSEDGLVSVDTTSCTGMCDQGPALLVNGRPLTRLSAERIDRISELVRAQVAVSDWPEEWFLVADNIRRRDVLLATASTPPARRCGLRLREDASHCSTS